MMDKFDRLNRETKDWNNGFRGRNLGWYDVHYPNGCTKSPAKKGRYLGNGQYVED